jgi:hypothetical protein
MADVLYGLAEFTGQAGRVTVCDAEMRPVAEFMSAYSLNPTVLTKRLAENIGKLSADHGGVAAVSVVTESVKNNLGSRVAATLGLPPERGGTLSRIQAATEGQRTFNAERGRPDEIGYVSILSRAWHGAPYSGKAVGQDDPGQMNIRVAGSLHPVANFVTGKGMTHRHDLDPKTVLDTSQGARNFVTVLSHAVRGLIKRSHDQDFPIEVIRWGGGIYTHRPELLRLAELAVFEELGADTPRWESLSMRGKAVLYGAFVDARQRAAA